jgi:hypothetical protein
MAVNGILQCTDIAQYDRMYKQGRPNVEKKNVMPQDRYSAHIYNGKEKGKTLFWFEQGISKTRRESHY